MYVQSQPIVPFPSIYAQQPFFNSLVPYPNQTSSYHVQPTINPPPPYLVQQMNYPTPLPPYLSPTHGTSGKQKLNPNMIRCFLCD